MKTLIHQNQITYQFIYLYTPVFGSFLSSIIITEVIVRRKLNLPKRWPQSISCTCPDTPRFKFLLTRLEYSCLKQYQTVNDSNVSDLHLYFIFPSILSNVRRFWNRKRSAFFMSLRLLSGKCEISQICILPWFLNVWSPGIVQLISIHNSHKNPRSLTEFNEVLELEQQHMSI